LILQLSSSTPEVVFGTDFSVEQQWEITSTGAQTSFLKVASGVHWTNDPWGSSVMSGTISERSADETRKSACHFVALIEQALKSEKEQKSIEPPKIKSANSDKRPLRSSGNEDLAQILGKGFDEQGKSSKSKKKNEKGKNIEGSLEDEPPNENMETSIETIASMPPNVEPPQQLNPITVKLPGPKTPLMGRVLPLLVHVFGLLQSFLVSPFFQSVFILVLIISNYSMLGQISILEGRISDSVDDAYTKVLFLESFIEKLGQNISGDPNIVKEHRRLFESTLSLEEELANWQKHLGNMIDKMRKQKDPSINELQQQLFKKLESTENTEPEPTGWIATIIGFLIWTAFILFWLGLILILVLHRYGIVDMRLPLRPN